MGYTHYWGIKKTKTKSQEVEALYQKAIKDCQKVIKAYREEHQGTEYSLSGYSAHTKLGQYGGLHFNGVKENKHEDFCMREHFKENEGFNFCKTNHKPYDVVVTACLSILKHYLKDNFDVNSDGDYLEWIDGVTLANKVLRRTKNVISSPIKFDAERDLRQIM